MSFWKYTNPNKFMAISEKLLPVFSILTVLLISIGLIWGFFFTPDDFRMGSTVKIIYLHVPSALIAINTWFVMLIGSLIWLIRRHHVSVLISKSAAPIGLIMTIVALITGAIWGQPMWGTFWAWDPRLTSFLILFFFYLGYIALWQSVDNHDKVADLASLLCLVGSVFAILSRYAVNFWNQGLHQGASLSLDKEENVSNVFWFPLIISITGFLFLFVTLLLIKTRTEIRLKQLSKVLAANKLG
ncbi:MAG: heme ABC transporter permease CcmC [Rhodobacterales bacterium]|jgi:heme exporter protein C|tara:strand:- start:1458 stop:2186 length:729 start_codon:yes stop_codon:yes gene_type:complete